MFVSLLEWEAEILEEMVQAEEVYLVQVERGD